MKKIILLSIALTFISSSTQAADPLQPGAIREQSIDTLKYYQLEKRTKDEEEKKATPREKSVVDETTEADKAPPKTTGALIPINKIVTTPSEILSNEEIHAITAPYEGKQVSINQLFIVVEAINNLYKEKKAIAAKAVLPPQKVKDGVIQIKLIEARVGAVKIENNENTRGSYITDRVSIKGGDLVRLSELEKSIFYFNSVNDIDIRAVLKPGAELGTTDYTLKVTEPPQYQTLVFIDNAGRDDVGLERLGLSFTNNSLLGYRDILTLGGQLAEGTESAYVSYNVPIDTLGTRLGISYDFSNIDVISGSLEPLNVEGDSSNFGVFVTHPYIVKPAFLLNGFVGVNAKKSNTEFDGETLFTTKIRTLSFGVDLQTHGVDSSSYSRHYLTNSSGKMGSDKSFFKYNGEYSHTRLLKKNLILLLRAKAQISNSELLPSSEQFQIGGMSTVRGYPEGLLIGDDGYFLSAELTYPMTIKEHEPSNSPFGQKMRGVLFLDHGGAFPFKGNDESTDNNDFLTSVGFGVNINLSRKLTGKVVVGIPLSHRDDVDGEDDPRIHFILQSILF